MERETNISWSLTLPILVETPINSSVFLVRHSVILGLATHTLLRWCCCRYSKTHTPFLSWHDRQSIHRHLRKAFDDCLQSDRLQKRHGADNCAWHFVSSLIETDEFKSSHTTKFSYCSMPATLPISHRDASCCTRRRQRWQTDRARVISVQTVQLNTLSMHVHFSAPKLLWCCMHVHVTTITIQNDAILLHPASDAAWADLFFVWIN